MKVVSAKPSNPESFLSSARTSEMIGTAGCRAAGAQPAARSLDTGEFQSLLWPRTAWSPWCQAPGDGYHAANSEGGPLVIPLGQRSPETGHSPGEGYEKDTWDLPRHSLMLGLPS